MSEKHILQWTDTLPDVPGWYWWQPGETTPEKLNYKGHLGIYRVEPFDLYAGILFVKMEHNITLYPVQMLRGRWAGPIPEPVGE